ncbi:SdrD B-like domain-containing protein [Cellulomonas hominis]|uniref:SdrD B-like domain-containing protein n=1 Tax=Cellulomonas hominis TaxID=156981 RepID=UPI001B9F39C1|nr:SdrD B-like domain-containing protein [Cellulomonas hominis]VTR76922.1 Serine-aspartate repeat-containing protein D [Cellulomonas hominis]
MNLLHRLRRPAVLSAVGALLAPIVLGTAAAPATAAGDAPAPTLQVTSFTVTAGAAAANPQPAADPAYASDLQYAASAATGTVTSTFGYRCASDTEDCVDAAAMVVLGQLRLTGPLPAVDLDPTTVVTYFSDAAATTTTADPAQAAAFRVAFRSALDDGGTGLRAGSNGSLRFDSVLVAPSAGGAQTGSAVATPSSQAGAGLPSRVRVTGQFPVNLATTTALSWSRTSYLSGVDDGVEQPTNTATVVATSTGDPAEQLTVTWGGADPSLRPAAGTAGMLTDLTSTAVTGWPAGAASLVVTGWRWTGASSATAQVAVGTFTPADQGRDLLAGLDAGTRAGLTGLRLVFAAADGTLLDAGAVATTVIAVREHGSAGSTPVARTGAAAEYVTTAPAATFDVASDLNTLAVAGTATSSAKRGANVTGAAAVTRGFRVFDPRAYAGSATSLRGLSAGTVYGGGYVVATAAGTNWSRRAVEQLELAVPSAASDVTATNAALDPDLPALDARVLGTGLTFAGFGAARSGAAGDGSGIVVSGLTGPAQLVLAVRTSSGPAGSVVLDAAAPVVPTGAASFGLTDWSQVTGFTATLRSADGTGAPVPMGASVAVPYLVRAATSAQAQTYAAHTTAATVLGGTRSALTPRTAQSGNRPVTAATVAVAVPTVGVDGTKYVAEPYVPTTAGSTVTAILEAVARAGASGHLPDTLTIEDSARAATSSSATGAAWWNAFRPVSVDPGAPAGVTATVQYYTNTGGAPAWQDYAGDRADLSGSDAWRGMRVVAVRADGTTFADGTVLRTRITFAVRDAVLDTAAWKDGAVPRNVAEITSSATIEGNVVTSVVRRPSDTVSVLGVAAGAGAPALLKTLSRLDGTEGTAQTTTATLTWGTGGNDLASATVADGNGLADGQGTPDVGGAASFFDTFDLTGITPITSGASPSGVHDPYLVFDQVTDVRVYDAVAREWHSLRTQKWDGTGWVAVGASRDDVRFTSGAAVGAFPYKGSFPGLTVNASLQARVGGVQLVYEARTDAERDALPAGDWRRALLPTLTPGAVASTDGPARPVALTLALRDTSRATGTPVNNAFRYTGTAAGTVVNSGRVTGWTGPGGTGDDLDLGGPVNPVGQQTFTVQPASLGVTATKTWLRDENGTPLEPSTDLDELALPVEGQDAPADQWPTATLTVTGTSTSTTRVDALTLTEPSGIDRTATLDPAALDPSAPFARFAITRITGVTTAAAVTGATDAQVVLYRWTAEDGVTASAPVPVATALGYDATALADVVGVQVRYTGRIQADRTARLTLATRLLPQNRVSGLAVSADTVVTNDVEATVSDARVCADETGSPTAATGCTAAVRAAEASATTTVREPDVQAFPALEVTPVDVQRDATVPTVTAVLSTQNFGLTPADALLVTDADPRYFNAVAARSVRVDRVPTGAERADLEVLVAGADLEIGADGTYDGARTWRAWGSGALGTTWDLATLAAAHGATADDVVGVRVRFVDTDQDRITAPGQGFGEATLAGVLREELRTGGLPSAVGADGWRYEGAEEHATNPGETTRGVVSNHVTAQALRDGLTSTEQTTADVPVAVHAGSATVRVQKAELDVAPRKPGDAVRYRITVTNTATGTGAADLTGLVVTDRLPEDGSLVYGTAPDGQQPWTVQGPGGTPSPLAAPVVQADESAVVLTFGADDRLAPGASVEVLLWLRVATDLSTTSVVNTATAASTSRPLVAAPSGSDGGTGCAPGTYDVDAAACLVRAAALTIGGANVYVSEEWVRDAAPGTGAVRTTPAKPGAPSACAPRGTGVDADWYRYPCSVVSTAGATTQWQVQVTSRASIAADRLEMVDMLPTVGDYPAMDGSASGSRGSAWRPVWDGHVPTLVSMAGLPAGATLAVYTTTADYRAGGLPASADFDPVPGTWSSTPLAPGSTVPAAQAARVTGFKLVVTFAGADKLSSGESVRVGWSMRTPLTGAPKEADTWNSFAFRVPADAGAGRPVDVTSVPLKAGARYAVAVATGDPLVAVGDRVWLDLDRDGVQDAGEDGVPGVVVDLYQGSGAAAGWAAETTTGAAGDWLVDGLPAGTYQVRLTLPPALAAQYRFTGADAGSDDLDSDAVLDADGALIADVVLGAGGPGTVAVAAMPTAWQDAHPGLAATHVDATRDAGLQWRPLAVGDTVWFDADRDGRQDVGEDPVPGATVRLLAADDAVVGSTTTAADGRYRFDALDPGTYRVEVELPDALAGRWTFTGALAGDATGDSDVVPVTARLGRTAAFTLTPGSGLVTVAELAGDPLWAAADADYADPSQDAGLAERPVRVGDRVWVDLDDDGVQDAGEPGLPGVVLTLTDALGAPVTGTDGAPVGPVTTDADGRYAFTGLLPGAYTVTVDAAASAAALAPYVPTPAGTPGDPATDSATGSATSAVLVGGGADDTLDFGYRPLRALGDRVWLDADRDGKQDAGEDALPGVTVRLLDGTGVVLATTVTGADGTWRFDLLEPGTYRVELELTPADAARYTWTAPRSGTAPRADADSDAEDTGTPGTGRTAAITVGPGAPGLRAATAADGVTAAYVDSTWDAGLVERSVSVGHLVWFDADEDGIQDAGERGLPGVVLELRTPDLRAVTAADGTEVAAVTTDADGRYAFTGLLPGEYVVRVDRLASASALAGYAPTVAGAGTDPAADSATWSAPSRQLVGGEEDTTLDFGMVLADDVQLALRKTAVARTADSITWDVTVASTGTQDAYAGFAVVDALPGALSFRTASGTGFACTAVGQVVTCDHDGSLPAGETATVRIVTGLTAADADVTNTATVDVTGRGYLFEVLAAQDVAWSEPGPTGPADPADPAADLAVTGATPAAPLGGAAALIVLGAALLALAGSRGRLGSGSHRHRA